MTSVGEQLLRRALQRHGHGDLAAALDDYRRLLALLPDDATAAVNGALAWHALGRPQAARAWCRWAGYLAPGLADVHRVTADNWQRLGDVAAARRSFRAGLALAPDAAELLNNFATLLAAAADDGALALAWRAMRVAPGQASPHGNLAALLLRQRQPAAALQHGLCAVLLQPAAAEGYNNLGTIRLDQGQDDPAATDFARARRLAPESPDAWINDSGLRLDRGDVDSGRAHSRVAVLLAPGQADAYNNLANGALLACALDVAERAFRCALTLAPEDAQTHFNFAAVLLKQGRLAEGWREYEWRRRTPAALARRRPDDPPDWPGGDPRGLTLLLDAEQGLGDALQFCRFAPWLAAQGARVWLRTHAPLQRLMQSLDGVAGVLGPDDPTPAADYHLPLMSVPSRFALALPDLPARLPYLAAPAELVAAWRRRLAPLPGIRIGLVWSGDPRPQQRAAHRLDRRRSMTLAQLARLGAVPGVTLVSLQKGAAALQTPPAGLALVDWTAELEDFVDTAALVSGLDLVISVDTSVAHLAAALNVPVWILSRFDGCWRWLQGRQDSPWYPAVRLFHQPAPGDWDSVVTAVIAALQPLS